MNKQTLENGTYGYEYEISDVNLHKAAEAVFLAQGRPFSEWRDRGKTSLSKVRAYSMYNISSDGQVWNNDGSLSRHTVMVDGELVKATEQNAHLWKCAEVISPVLQYSNIEKDQKWLEFYLDLMQKKGGVVSPWNWNDFNIHVGLENWEVSDVQELLKWYRGVRELFLDFRDPFTYTDQQDPRQYDIKTVTYNRLMRAETREEMFKFKGKRPIFSTIAWADDRVPHNTVEWRQWPLTTDPAVLKRLIEISVECTYTLPEYNTVASWMSDVKEMSLINLPVRPSWSKSPVDEAYRHKIGA